MAAFRQLHIEPVTAGVDEARDSHQLFHVRSIATRNHRRWQSIGYGFDDGAGVVGQYRVFGARDNSCQRAVIIQEQGWRPATESLANSVKRLQRVGNLLHGAVDEGLIRHV